MSYILEALKKADQERVVGKVPDLDSVHERVPPTRRNSRWIWILAALLVVNGMLVAAYVLYKGNASDGPEHAAVAPAPVVETAPPVATTVMPARPAVPVRPAIPPRPAVTTRPPAPRSPARPYVPPAARPAPASKPAAAVTPPVTPQARGTVTRAEQPLDAAPAPAAQAATTPPAKPASGLPYWDDLSLEFRSGFTAPRIDVHVYDADPRRRFILVDLKKYREGDRLASGAQLEKITPEGVQLSFQGKQFIYRQ
jgi:general secretion pathway protein B